MTNSDSEWVSLAGYARTWGVSERTVQRWVASGRLVEGVEYRRTPSGRVQFLRPRAAV